MNNGIASVQSKSILSFLNDTTIEYTTCVSPPDTTQKSSGIKQINDHLNNELSVSVYPNPASTKVHFKFSIPINEKLAVLKIYDGSGNCIDQYELSGQKDSFEFNCLNLLSGVYFYTFETISSIKRGKFVVTR